MLPFFYFSWTSAELTPVLCNKCSLLEVTFNSNRGARRTASALHALEMCALRKLRRSRAARHEHLDLCSAVIGAERYTPHFSSERSASCADRALRTASHFARTGERSETALALLVRGGRPGTQPCGIE